MITIMGFDDWTMCSSKITITDNGKNPPAIKSAATASDDGTSTTLSELSMSRSEKETQLQDGPYIFGNLCLYRWPEA